MNVVGQMPWLKPILALLPHPTEMRRYKSLASKTVASRATGSKDDDLLRFLVRDSDVVRDLTADGPFVQSSEKTTGSRRCETGSSSTPNNSSSCSVHCVSPSFSDMLTPSHTAGGEAISTTTNVAVYNILAHPPYVKQLRAELESTSESHPETLRSQLAQLPFLNACIKVSPVSAQESSIITLHSL